MAPVLNSRTPALLTFVALVGIYGATLAPDVTFWDSGEFLAAIHSLGIPHPPGTPLYVIAANVWARLLSPLFGFARAVNLFSAVCAAAGCAVLADLFNRWTRDPLLAFAASICAGATSTLWLSATESEVYAPAYFLGTAMLWIGNRVGTTGDRKWWMLLAYTAGLAWTLHLTALLVLPAALVLALGADKSKAGLRRSVRMLVLALPLMLLGGSAVMFMYFRTRHDPAVNQGNPSTFGALIDVVSRRQYGEFKLWPRQAPLFMQFGNLFEWADWQFALGLDEKQPPSFARTPITIAFALLGLAGTLKHRVIDRASWRSLITLFVTASVGVGFYLNLKAGPSYGAGWLASSAPHEARERDYFFILVWVCWGLWAGVGAHVAARSVFKGRKDFAKVAGLALAASPFVLNWRAVERARERDALAARELGTGILSSAPPNAVILARGDNDTYTVWYLREVERLRSDVISVTVPMLPAPWYRAELVRRYRLLPPEFESSWMGSDSTLKTICALAKQQNRPVVGPFEPAEKRMKAAC